MLFIVITIPPPRLELQVTRKGAAEHRPPGDRTIGRRRALPGGRDVRVRKAARALGASVITGTVILDTPEFTAKAGTVGLDRLIKELAWLAFVRGETEDKHERRLNRSAEIIVSGENPLLIGELVSQRQKIAPNSARIFSEEHVMHLLDSETRAPPEVVGSRCLVKGNVIERDTVEASEGGNVLEKGVLLRVGSDQEPGAGHRINGERVPALGIEALDESRGLLALSRLGRGENSLHGLEGRGFESLIFLFDSLVKVMKGAVELENGLPTLELANLLAVDRAVGNVDAGEVGEAALVENHVQSRFLGPARLRIGLEKDNGKTLALVHKGHLAFRGAGRFQHILLRGEVGKVRRIDLGHERGGHTVHQGLEACSVEDHG